VSEEHGIVLSTLILRATQCARSTRTVSMELSSGEWLHFRMASCSTLHVHLGGVCGSAATRYAGAAGTHISMSSGFVTSSLLTST
jgi:hypothetical protein